MENKSAIWKNSMNYGAITGFASIIYTIILYITDFIFDTKLNALGSYYILIVGISYGTKVLRDKFENGYILYGQALASGVLISLFAAIIIAFFNYILYTVIDPELIEKSIGFMEERLIKQGRLSDDQIEIFLEKIRERYNPLQNSLITIPSNTFIGFLLSLITSAILKIEPIPYETTSEQITKTEMTIDKALFSFNGRISKSDYWLKGLLILYPITIINIHLIYNVSIDISNIIALIIGIISIWPSLALLTKRLHDRNRSAWFILLLLIPLVNIWIGIEILFFRGTIGPNRFGNDPELII